MTFAWMAFIFVLWFVTMRTLKQWVETLCKSIIHAGRSE